MARQVESREQLVAEVAALRLRVRALEHEQQAPSPTASEGVIAVDARGRVTLCNPAAAVLTGWPAEDALSQPVDQVLSVEDEFGPGLVRGTLRDGAARHLETVAIHRGDGSPVEVRLSVLPLTDRGATVGALVTIQPTSGNDPVADEARRHLAAFRAIADLEWPSESRSLENLARHALDVILQAVEADRAAVTLADDDATTVSVPDSAQDGLAGPVASVGGDPEVAAGAGAGAPRSLMALPLRSRGRTAGMLSVSSQNEDHFDPIRARVLAAFASTLATTIEAGRLEGKVQQRESMLDAIHAITAVGSSPATPNEKIARISQIAAWVAKASIAGIFVEPPGGLGYWTAASGHAAPEAHQLSMFGPLCASTGPSTLVADAGHPDWPEELRRGVASIFPIYAGAVRYGSFLIVTSEPLEARVQRVLTGAADTLGLVFDAARKLSDTLDMQRREQDQLRVFRGTAAQLALTEHPEHVLSGLVTSALETTGASAGCIAVWDDDGTARTVMSAGNPTTVALAQALDRTRNSVLTADRPSIRITFNRQDDPAAELQNLLAVPFPHRDGPPGCLVLFDKEGGSFSEEDEGVLHLFSTMAAVLLDNLDLYEAVKRERRTLEALQDSMTEGLLVLDDEGVIAISNPAARALLGTKGRRLAGQRLEAVLTRRKPDFPEPEQLRTLLSALDRSATPQLVEVQLGAATLRDIAVSVFPIEASFGEHLTGVLLRDVTDEREVERRRDTFVSVASHELRTPMTTILGFSELLLTGQGKGAQRTKWLQHINKDTERVVGIVDDLLNVSRIQSGNVSLHPEPVRIGDALTEAVSVLTGAGPTHEIVVRAAADLPSACADPAKLRQVITNLVSNAMKYSPAGSRISVEADRDDELGQLVIRVTDQGMGIPKKEQGRLFQTFQRVDRPETRDIHGTGLGLFIVKGLVEFMGGEVGLDSQLRKGSTFWFSIPLIEQAEAKR